MHGLDEAKIVSVPGQVGPEFADPGAAVTALAELPHGVHHNAGSCLVFQGHVEVFETLDGQRFSVVFPQQWLGIKGIDLRHTAVHEQKDHTFGFCRMMRTAGCGEISG